MACNKTSAMGGSEFPRISLSRVARANKIQAYSSCSTGFDEVPDLNEKIWLSG